MRGLPIVAVLAASVLVSAHEPDGRVAIRYDWPEAKAGDSAAPRLRILLTAIVDLSDLRLSASVPSGIGLAVRALDRAPEPWPDEGLPIGDLSAGKSIVIDLDVEKPPQGGGIVGFSLRGVSGGVPILEGVGVPVGSPGAEPTLRNGALEFPAAQGDPAP